VRSSSNHRWRKIAVILLSGFLVFVAGAFILFRGASASSVPLPDPNGYDLLRQATSQIGERLDNYRSLPDAELQSYLEENRAALMRAREGLKLPSAVPVEYDQKWITRQTPVMLGIRRLGHAFKVEADLHTRRGEIDQSLESAMDLVRLGRAAGNKGVTIDFLVGTACEIQGLVVITNLLAQMSPEQCRSVARTLQEMDQTRENLNELFRREKRWMVASSGFFVYVKEMVEYRTLHPERQSFLGDSLQDAQSRLRTIRFETLQIAARGFELEHGRRPTSIVELVPRFLSTLPIDPVTELPMELIASPQ
jgi:uncharacterized protein (DUF1778 family)